MSEYRTFRKAHRLVQRAQRLTRPLLNPRLYPLIFEDFDYLLKTLDQLAIEGPVTPLPNTGSHPP